MSREILAFGALLGATLGAALLPAGWWRLGGLALGSGVGAVAIFTSARLYQVTGRPFWSSAYTLARFGLSAVLVPLAVFYLATQRESGGVIVLGLLVLAGSLTLVLDAFPWRTCSRQDAEMASRLRLLIQGPLRWPWCLRLGLLACGAILFPLESLALRAMGPVPELLATGLAIFQLLLILASEVMGRSLFFRLGISRGMPGGPNGC